MTQITSKYRSVGCRASPGSGDHDVLEISQTHLEHNALCTAALRRLRNGTASTPWQKTTPNYNPQLDGALPQHMSMQWEDGLLRPGTDFLLEFPKDISHEPCFTMENQTNSINSTVPSLSLVASFNVCFGLLFCLESPGPLHCGFHSP